MHPRVVIPSGARNLTIEARDTQTYSCEPKPCGRSFASLRMTAVKNMSLKFVGGMGAEDEFKLEENRIDLAIRQEEVFLEKIVIVLQPDF
jgi:hypothetical protein